MAFRLFRACATIKNNLKQCQSINSGTAMLRPTDLSLNINRGLNFFNAKSAESLWKGVTSVSNPGKKRGRARGLARKKDLNRGQILGVGKINIQFPGLNAPVYRGRELLQQKVLPPSTEYQERIKKFRDTNRRKKTKLHPLERGWTSASVCGQKWGPPDPVLDETFNDFQSWVLESKIVCKMTGNIGRRRRSSGFIILGNGKGLAGFALANGSDAKQALAKAKNKAIKKLLYVERYQEHTVVHDFASQFGKTRIYVRQMPEGYGLICHRAIRACCEAIGIKNLYAKAEGSRNVKNLVKAFFVGLIRQKSFQQIAEEKKLHLVQFNNTNFQYPVVMASPSTVRSNRDLKSNEMLNFKEYLLEGRVMLQMKRIPPFYTRLPSWNKYLRKQERLRDQDKIRIQLEVENGGIKSFLAEKYPEADRRFVVKKSEAEEETA